MRQPVAYRVFQFELVAIPGLEARHEQHPVTALAALHRVATAIPEVEIADEAHRGGARRIDRKTHPFHLLIQMLHGAQLGTERMVEVFRLVGEFRQPGPARILELIGVDDLDAGIWVVGKQLVGEGIFTAGENSFKEARIIGGRQGGNNLARLEILTRTAWASGNQTVSLRPGPSGLACRPKWEKGSEQRAATKRSTSIEISFHS